MAMVFITGLIIVFFMEIGYRIKLMDLEYTNGTMEESMKDNGKIMICMEREHINGQTGECTKDRI